MPVTVETPPAPKPQIAPINIVKSPINIIYESFPNATFQCVSSGAETFGMRFKVQCVIEDRTFEGFGKCLISHKDNDNFFLIFIICYCRI